MAFIFSKLLLFFLHPFLWAMVLVTVGLLVKKRQLRKKLLLGAAAITLLFSNPFLLNRVSRWWDYPRPQLAAGAKYSAAIVLGGFVSEDAQGKGFFNGAADRFVQGLRLYQTGQVSHVLVTGGNASLMPDGFTEGGWITGEFKALHVPDSAVLIEKKSRNTTENAGYSKLLLQHAALKSPYLLVTSAFHMRRALATFRAQGIQVIPYACSFGGGADTVSFDDFIPSAGVMDGWTVYLKEIIGLAVVSIKK